MNTRFDTENYISVADRIATLKADHPASRIVTTVIAHTPDLKRGFIRAEIFLDMDALVPSATGLAEGNFDDGDKWLEKTETVAIGRACANLGMSREHERMSREEAQRFQSGQQRRPGSGNVYAPRTGQPDAPATERQLAAVAAIAQQRGLAMPSNLTRGSASAFIEQHGGRGGGARQDAARVNAAAVVFDGVPDHEVDDIPF